MSAQAPNKLHFTPGQSTCFCTPKMNHQGPPVSRAGSPAPTESSCSTDITNLTDNSYKSYNTGITDVTDNTVFTHASAFSDFTASTESSHSTVFTHASAFSDFLESSKSSRTSLYSTSTDFTHASAFSDFTASTQSRHSTVFTHTPTFSDILGSSKSNRSSIYSASTAFTNASAFSDFTASTQSRHSTVFTHASAFSDFLGSSTSNRSSRCSTAFTHASAFSDFTASTQSRHSTVFTHSPAFSDFLGSSKSTGSIRSSRSIEVYEGLGDLAAYVCSFDKLFAPEESAAPSVTRTDVPVRRREPTRPRPRRERYPANRTQAVAEKASEQTPEEKESQLLAEIIEQNNLIAIANGKAYKRDTLCTLTPLRSTRGYFEEDGVAEGCLLEGFPRDLPELYYLTEAELNGLLYHTRADLPSDVTREEKIEWFLRQWVRF